MIRTTFSPGKGDGYGFTLKKTLVVPQVYDIARSRPSTNMYFEEKNGELFYLDNDTGFLSAAQILPYHPILNIPIPDALRIKISKRTHPMKFHYSKENLKPRQAKLQRSLEILPGACSWGVLLGLIFLSIFFPFIAAILLWLFIYRGSCGSCIPPFFCYFPTCS